jgi:hypothetical protein
MCSLLLEAVDVSIARVHHFSPLKSWTAGHAAREGVKKAAVAAARKSAVVLRLLWRDQTKFARIQEALQA